jgi:hypothetical protein
VDYAAGWAVVAGALLVAVVAWNVGVLLWGRPRRVRVPATHRPDVALLRKRYLTQIDQVEADHAAGRVDLRDAHRRLSALSRGFVQEASGRPTTAMTLADLRRHDLVPLVDVVEVAYPPAFAPGTDRPAEELARAAERAREAVRSSWS